MNVNLLFKGLCTVEFTLKDGSKLDSVTSLNPDILRRYNIAEVDGLVDLTLGKVIPEDLLFSITDIREGVVMELPPLDKMFQEEGKTSWTV